MNDVNNNEIEINDSRSVDNDDELQTINDSIYDHPTTEDESNQMNLKSKCDVEVSESDSDYSEDETFDDKSVDEDTKTPEKCFDRGNRQLCPWEIVRETIKGQGRGNC